MSASQEPDETPGWIRRLAKQVWVHKTNVLISFVAAVLGSPGQAVVPLVARTIVDDVIGQDGARLWPWLALLVVIAVAVFVLRLPPPLPRRPGRRIAVQYDLRNGCTTTCSPSTSGACRT